MLMSLLKKIYYFLIISTTLYICFYQLGLSSLTDWDEAWYGEVAKQMLRSKEYIVPHWNGSVFFDKPPLYMWVTSFVAQFIGLNEFSVRFTSAVAGAITIILAFRYSLNKWGIIPSFLTFVTLSLNNIFIWRVRSGNLDALTTLFIFLVYFVTISHHKYRHIFLGVLFSVIYLTKASLMGLPFVIFCSYEIIYRSRDIKIYWKRYLQMVLIIVVFVGGWLTLSSLKVGVSFVKYYLFASDQGVMNLSLEFFKSNYLWHVYYSLQRRFFFVFCFGIIFLIPKIKKGTTFLLLANGLALILFLSFTERDNNWYLLPSVPFWSLIIGYGTFRFINLIPKIKYILIITVLIPTLYVTQKTYRENIIPIIQTNSGSQLKEAAIYISKNSEPNEVVIRLDQLYPLTIYYSDRVVHSAYDNEPRTGEGLFWSRDKAYKMIDNGSIHWVSGTTEDVENFKTKYEVNGEIIVVNEKESILRAIPNTDRQSDI